MSASSGRYSVRCPTCLAHGGKPCRTTGTQRVTDTHAPRIWWQYLPAEQKDKILASHRPAHDWHCACGYDHFGGSAAYGNLLYDEHIAGVIRAAYKVRP